MHGEEGVPAYKQTSQGLAKVSKTTRFMETTAQQEATAVGLTGSSSGIPAGASAQWWMLNRLLPALANNSMLLLGLVTVIVCLQVCTVMLMIVAAHCSVTCSCVGSMQFAALSLPLFLGLNSHQKSLV